MTELLNKVKLSLLPPVVTNDFDILLTDLIFACLADLGVAGVSNHETTDALIIRAVITYCQMNFGSPEEYDRLKKSYDEQKAQLGMASGYTTWSN